MTEIARPGPTALARMDEEARGGMAALAQLPEEEFEFRLGLLKKGRERIERIHRELMEPEVDYGKIPGTGDKPTLLQPGAEKLCSFYHLVPSFTAQTTYGDGESAPHITVVVDCLLHQGAQTGPVVGAGLGACNSWEKKYRYRRGERACPDCGSIGTVIKGKAEYGGGWLCFARKGGCGAKFTDRDVRITEQVVGEIENADPFDLLNTLVKMAKKRALIDATKTTTATSALYSQDLEDTAPADPPAPGPPSPPPGPPQAPPRAQAAVQAGETAANYGGVTGASEQRTCTQCPTVVTNGQLQVSMRKFGEPRCPKHQTNELQMQPTPAGRTPQQERMAQNGRMFAAYDAACSRAGYESNDATMRVHCGLVLTKATGQEVTVASRSQLTTEQLRICADYFEQHGLTGLDDPFINE